MPTGCSTPGIAQYTYHGSDGAQSRGFNFPEAYLKIAYRKTKLSYWYASDYFGAGSGHYIVALKSWYPTWSRGNCLLQVDRSTSTQTDKFMRDNDGTYHHWRLAYQQAAWGMNFLLAFDDTDLELPVLGDAPAVAQCQQNFSVVTAVFLAWGVLCRSIRYVFKLSAGMAVLITLVVTLLTVLGWFSTKSNNDAAIALLQTVRCNNRPRRRCLIAAGGIAQETSALINRNFDLARSMSALLSSTAHGSADTPYSREQVQQQAGVLLRSNAGISALYAQFEANGYDQADSQHDGSQQHSSKQGTMEIYWVRDGQDVKFVQVPGSGGEICRNAQSIWHPRSRMVSVQPRQPETLV